MVILDHIKHKSVESNASPVIQEFRKGPACTTDGDDKDSDTSGTSPQGFLSFWIQLYFVSAFPIDFLHPWQPSGLESG